MNGLLNIEIFDTLVFHVDVFLARVDMIQEVILHAVTKPRRKLDLVFTIERSDSLIKDKLLLVFYLILTQTHLRQNGLVFSYDRVVEIVVSRRKSFETLVAVRPFDLQIGRAHV